MSNQFERLAVLGVPIDNLTLDETVKTIDKLIQNRQFQQIATANVDFLMKAIQDDELMEILHRCALVLPDGMPLIWASRVLGTPLQERVAGADLVPRLAQLAALKSYGIFLLGAKESRNMAAADWILRTHPGARVVGRYSPPLADLDDMDHEDILTRIEASGADILLVAFGNPKQEKWIAMHRYRLKVPVCIGVGASLDFLSGDHQRAPAWMQTSGLEWLHRLYKEPGRLAQRYTSNAVGLLRHLTVQLVVMSTQPRAQKGLALSHRWMNETSIVSVTGRFTGDIVSDFKNLLDTTNLDNTPIVIDLFATEYIGADALGALISLSNRMRRDRRELWLTGIRPSIRRVLRSAFLDRHFRLAPGVSEAVRRIDMLEMNR